MKQDSDTGGSRARQYLEKTAGRAWNLVAGFLPFNDENISESLRTTIALIKTALLGGGGYLEDGEIELFGSVFGRRYPAHKVAELIRCLKECDPISPEAAAPELRKLPEESQLAILQILMELDAAGGDGSEVRGEMIARLAELMEISPGRLEETVAAADRQGRAERRRLLKSGAGILVALMVILLFIGTATVLKSVVFGLILAYLFLPLERFYERCLAGRRNPFFWIFHGIDVVLSPLPRLARRLSGRGRAGDLPEAVRRERENSQRTTRATSLTVLTAVLLALVVVLAVSSWSAGYVWRIGDSVNSFVHNAGKAVENPEAPETAPRPEEPVPAAGEATEAVAEAAGEAAGVKEEPQGVELTMLRINQELEFLKRRFESIPPVRSALTEISKFLAREDAGEVVVDFLMRKTLGIFSFTAEFFSWIGSLLLNILLTIFFFSLFLSKIATAIRRGRDNRDGDGRDRGYGAYLVRTVFNGKWLPQAREETLKDAEEIIEQVIIKLRTWLRGYLILMTIDFTVYTTVFYFLGVPYFALFGLIAACGVLLPFIGPTVAALLTVLVTLAAGGSAVSALQILGIVGIFLWHNGVVDQFFLYPLIIGDALGLSTLETIIVVLLGGIFAGLTGMIFALPAAAVIKYLVPQIYSRWKAPA